MSFNHLTQEDRHHIYALKATGKSNSDIALALGKHKSSIGRELRRNQGARGYRPSQANDMARERWKYSEKAVKLNVELMFILAPLIEDKWSPDQISGWLRENENISISHETIYKFILEDKAAGGSLYTHLRWQKKRKKRYGTKSHDRRGKIEGKVSIEERPEIVDEKIRTGDWEGDLVIGKNHKEALVTLVDRKSKLVKMMKVKSKKAEEVADAILDALGDMRVHTITFDNGKEFTRHVELAQVLDAKIYFAHPYCSHERGLNENTNGLIRQYFPKKSDFTKLSHADVSFVENELNNRPRKALNYCTPIEVYFNQKRPRNI